MWLTNHIISNQNCILHYIEVCVLTSHVLISTSNRQIVLTVEQLGIQELEKKGFSMITERTEKKLTLFFFFFGIKPTLNVSSLAIIRNGLFVYKS